MILRVRWFALSAGGRLKSRGGLILISLVCAGSCMLGAGRTDAQVRPMAKANTLSVEKKAIAARGNDPQAVAALVDEVLNVPHFFPRLPASLGSMVKNRLVQAEILYRQGKKHGVQEQDIVDTLNGLVDQLGGPPYLKTTLSQVRVLRMWMAFSQPTFMGTGMARPDANIGESVNSAMAPVQAVSLIETLIDEKLNEPDFQVTPEEWERTFLAKVKGKIAEQQGIADAMRATMRRTGQASMATATARAVSPDKRREIERTLYPKISSLSDVAGLALINEVLTKLHLE